MRENGLNNIINNKKNNLRHLWDNKLKKKKDCKHYIIGVSEGEERVVLNQLIPYQK